MSDEDDSPPQGPLAGLRVLELGQLLAGPWAATLLGWFGAEVIEVEPPAGDPIRSWRVLDEGGTSYWWRSIGRNKRCVALDLRQEEGRALAKRLALECDVIVENFRPGTMERWGLGPEIFEAEKPSLIYARVSGYGQTGPYRDRPGYASVAEAIGGLRHLTGHPGEPSVRPNLSLGDTVAGLHTALGVLVALLERQRSGRGQVIDTALYESVFALLEAVVPEHSGAGAVRQPSGKSLTGVVPSSLYPCAGGKHVVIGANGETVFARLMGAIGRPELARDPRFRDNPSRVSHAETLDAIIGAWTEQRTVGQVVDALVEASVPCGPIYDAADMRADPHFQARGLYEPVEVDGRRLELPALQPRLTRTPGRTRWAGRAVGEDTDSALGDLLGLKANDLERLRRDGIIR
ncbi:MAG: CoA transferase [Sandaracinaceae bacterium]|nr:MAG: CoA transferase [Sandaracinaceae bacterium]